MKQAGCHLSFVSVQTAARILNHNAKGLIFASLHEEHSLSHGCELGVFGSIFRSALLIFANNRFFVYV
jgi:hypothetical protein